MKKYENKYLSEQEHIQFGFQCTGQEMPGDREAG